MNKHVREQMPNQSRSASISIYTDKDHGSLSVKLVLIREVGLTSDIGSSGVLGFWIGSIPHVG